MGREKMGSAWCPSPAFAAGRGDQEWVEREGAARDPSPDSAPGGGDQECVEGRQRIFSFSVLKWRTCSSLCS